MPCAFAEAADAAKAPDAAAYGNDSSSSSGDEGDDDASWNEEEEGLMSLCVSLTGSLCSRRGVRLQNVDTGGLQKLASQGPGVLRFYISLTHMSW